MSEKVNKRSMRIMLGQADDIPLPGNDYDYLVSRKREEEKRIAKVKKRRRKLQQIQDSDNQNKADSIFHNCGPFMYPKEIDDVPVEKSASCNIEGRVMGRKMDVSRQHVGLTLYERSRQLKAKVPIINSHMGLCYYDGICYRPLTEENTIKLYRMKVDRKLDGEKNLSSISQLYRILKTDPEIPIVQDNMSNARIVNLLNGIYDVENQHLFQHSPEYKSFSYIRANYKKHEKCPLFDEFVRQVTGGDIILEKRLWMFLGYLFMQTNEAKVFFVMGDAPDSGKSVLGRLIESFYDEDYISNVSLNNFGKEFALSTLLGAAVNLSMDLPDKQITGNAVATLKMLTGGDAINLNQKNIPEQRFVNGAKFIFATNHPIQISGDDRAFWNRLIYLPFQVTVPKEQQNPHLLELFEAEKDAIVTKAIKYAGKLVQSGFEFPTTKEIEEKIKQWRGIESDTVELFLKQCCRISPDCKGEVLSDLYAGYERYCLKSNQKSIGDRELKKYLEQQVHLEHFKMRRAGEGNPLSAFRGIKLIKESEE